MRLAFRCAAVVSVAALAFVAGCSEDAAPADTATTSTSDPAEETSPPEPSPEPTPTPEPSAEPAPTPEAPPALTTLAPEVMLPGSAYGAETDTPSEITELVDAWALPESCGVGGSSTALVSRAVAYGDGAYESVVGIQQLAVFPDAGTARAEMDRIHREASLCVNIAQDGQTIYAVESIGVGAQGIGLATDYYGSSATGNLDEAMGYYVVMTRRGNAVTLVGYVGGESTIGPSRENAVSTSQAAWELLCVYDSAGC